MPFNSRLAGVPAWSLNFCNFISKAKQTLWELEGINVSSKLNDLRLWCIGHPLEPNAPIFPKTTRSIMDGIEEAAQRSLNSAIDQLVYYYGWDNVVAAFSQHLHYQPSTLHQKIRHLCIRLLSHLPWRRWLVYPQSLAESVHILVINFGNVRINNYQAAHQADNH